MVKILWEIPWKGMRNALFYGQNAGNTMRNAIFYFISHSVMSLIYKILLRNVTVTLLLWKNVFRPSDIFLMLLIIALHGYSSLSEGKRQGLYTYFLCFTCGDVQHGYNKYCFFEM